MSIIITGSRKGIGRFLTEYYLEKGYHVIGCSRNDSDLVHSNYTHYNVDISNEQDVQNMVNNIRKNKYQINILINNAGIASMNHSLFTPTITALNVINTNFIGTFIMCREISRLMRNVDNARIINFSTIAKPLNLEGESVYASSKSAVETFTKILAKELSNFNITVNAIAPTPIKTDLIEKVPIEKINKILESQTIKRFGTFEDVSNIIDFFIKPESNFITGQILYLGGIS